MSSMYTSSSEAMFLEDSVTVNLGQNSRLRASARKPRILVYIYVYYMLRIRRSELEVLKPDASDLGSDG